MMRRVRTFDGPNHPSSAFVPPRCQKRRRKRKKKRQTSLYNKFYNTLIRLTTLVYPQKAKLKLGKGKKLPANQIDTSFKARCMRNSLSCESQLLIVCQAIALPAQSITLEKDPNEPTTKRKLTFNDLVAHLKHHNSGVKKGAPPHGRLMQR